MTTTPTPDPLETILDEWLVHDLECQSNLTDDIKDCTCIAKDIKRNLMPALTAHFKTVCEEVIGNDNKEGDPCEDSAIPMQFSEVGYRNALRAEQRTRLHERLEGEKS